MSEDVKHKWDARYTAEIYVFGEEPLPLLYDFADQLPDRGRALDVACGEGRNAVFLAEWGLDVVAVDISAVGLRKARELAERRKVTIKVALADLERHPLPEGPFDVVVCAHFMQRSLRQPITDALAPGGMLVMELHTLDNLKHHSRPARQFLVEPNELLSWFPELRLVHYAETLTEQKHAVAQLVARKPGATPNYTESH